MNFTVTFNNINCPVNKTFDKDIIAIRYFTLTLIINRQNNFVNITKLQEQYPGDSKKKIKDWDNKEIKQAIRKFFDKYHVEYEHSDQSENITGTYIHPLMLMPFIMWYNPDLYVSILNALVLMPKN